jgi:two-component system, OmpR family, sensor kinase
MSLRLRLAIGLASVIAISLGLLGFAVMRSTRADLQSALRRQLSLSLTDRVTAGPPPLNSGSATVDPRVLATAHLVADRDNRVSIAEPAGAPSNATPLPMLTQATIADLRMGSTKIVGSVDDSLRYLVIGAETPDGRIEIEAAPLDVVDETLATLLRRFVLGALATLVLTMIAVVMVVRRGLHPLTKVIETADAVAAGELEQRIPTDEGPTEIRRLSSAIDRMLEQQRASLTQQAASEARLRRFVSDASHELQTPITSVLGWAQLQRKGALDAAGTLAAMERIESEGRRMSVLVDDLLLLAQLDEQRPLQLLAIDLGSIAQEAVRDASVVDPDHPVSYVAPSNAVVVTGEADRLRQVVDNLLRNVRVHTPAGTSAVLTVRVDGGSALLTVEDDGPGIDPQFIERAFDRFSRQDPSRTRATGGAGLGLAIIGAIITAHGGSVAATNRPGGGAAVAVSLPLAPSASL